MASTSQRVPPSEWSKWKDTILALTHDNTLKEVMGIMKDEHGFIASRSQFEFQLDNWEDRKNLKKHEWAVVLEKLDSLTSRGMKSRILISGHPIPTSRIQRARRYCRSGCGVSTRGTIKEGQLAGLRMVSIETLGADGRWISHNTLDNVDGSDQMQTAHEHPLPNSSPVEDVSNGGATADDSEFSNREVVEGVDFFGLETTLPHFELSHMPNAQYLEINMVGEGFLPPKLSSPSLFDPSRPFVIQSPLQLEPSHLGSFDFGSSSWDLTGSTDFPIQLSVPMPFCFSNSARSMLDDLPFKRFKKDLEVQGVHLTPNSSGVHLASMVHNPVKSFLLDVESSVSENEENQPDARPLDAKSILLSLKSLLPSQNVREDFDSNYSLITEDQMLQIQFNQTLVFSIANGFAGLQGVPIQSVLKYLSRYGGMSSLLLQFLQASQTLVAKALAENLFRAAIEAKNESALKRLLAIRSVDVDATICVINGEKYTPVERAAKIRNLGVVELLLTAGADVNKTFALEPCQGGALARLTDEIGWGATISPETAELTNVLLKAGAKVHSETVERFLRIFHGHQLAYRLFSSASESDHSKVVAHELLSSIAEQLDDRQATEAVRSTLSTCERMNCGCCWSRFNEKLDRALVQGAKRGHLHFVQLLLRYSKSLHRVLSAAIRSGRSELIDTVLALRPDIDAPAHSIDDREPSIYQDKTTSLAEAIEAKNERLVHMIEGENSLDHLNEGGRFEPAIAAASKIGDISYIRKLLDRYPSAEPSHMARALLYAMENDHEEIFWALFAAGANVNSRHQDLLSAAILRRNDRVLRGILNAGVESFVEHLDYSRGKSGLKRVVEWGDISILRDLQLTFPALVFRDDDLEEPLKKGNMKLFEFLVSSGRVSRSALTWCLNFAICRGDAEMVHSLIELGADPSDGLTTCAREYPKMLRLLLERIPRTSRYIVSGFGTDALMEAIRLGRLGFEAVTVLLESGLVDITRISSSRPIETPLEPRLVNSTRIPFSRSMETPLGLAIKVSQKDHHAEFSIIKKLLDAGCDPNSIVTLSEYGRNQTALLEAIETKSKDVVQLMIDRGASVTREATLGLKRTPLQKAVEVDSLEIVTLLLDAGADVNAKPAIRGGATALQLAAIGGNCNIAAKLLEHGADLQAQPAGINGRWPLEGAAEYGRLEMAEYLWKVSVTGFDKEQCRRAMELAEGNGHMACRDSIAALSLSNVPALNHWPTFDTQPELTLGHRGNP